MKSWWKKREKENLENQKLQKQKEKEDLQKKIKLDKITQKEKEKKANEDLQRKIKNNYERKKKDIKETEKEIIIGKENKRMEKLLEKRNNKEKLNKLKEEKEKEKEKEREIKLNSKNYHNNNNKKKKKKILTYNKSEDSIRRNKTNSNKLRGKNTKNKNEQNNNIINNNESLNASIITQDEQEMIKQNFETRNKLIEKYQNNSNIYRCLKCKLIPNIIINEFNQEIESFCDDSYNDVSHHNITTYSNFQDLSLNHPIDNNNISCYYCNKVINELASGETIYYCSLCNIYFCTTDEELHKNQKHKNYENLKEKYLELSKNNIKIITNKTNNSTNNNNSSQNKKSKLLNKQSSTPALLKKNNNKEKNQKKKTNPNKTQNEKEKENNDINKDNNPINIKNNSIILPDKTKEKKKNKNYNKVQIYLIDSYCNIHNEINKSYCFNCHKNICEICEDNHKNHKLINLEDIFLEDEELLEKKNELNKSKEELMKINDYFSALIEAIKCKFQRLFNIKKKELEIKEKIIQDYETIKYNYQCINNIRNIKFDNKSYVDKSKNTDWFHRFNLIFKYLNSDLNINNNDIFDILNNRNDKNNINIISSNNFINTNINKLIVLKNDDIAISTQNGNIIIYDKDNLKEKLNIKISENNSGINDFIEKEGGGIICCGHQYIKLINLSLNNKNYDIINQFDIKEKKSNNNSIIELNNNLFITSNNNENLKLWKMDKKTEKYKCIEDYNFNKNNINEDYNLLFRIKDNSFILSSFKKCNLSMFIINNYDKIEAQKTLENINIIKGNNSIIKYPYEDYILLSCYENDENKEILKEANIYNNNLFNIFRADFAIEIIDINSFNIIGKIKNRNPYIDINYYFDNIFIALDKEGVIHKIEFDKYQQNLYYLDEIKLNNNFGLDKDIIKSINITNNRKNLVLQLNNKIIKLSNYE